MHITEEEWNSYVNYVCGQEYFIPQSFLQDYNEWTNRSRVGRALYFFGKKEEAMIVLSTVMDVEPSQEDPGEGAMPEVEHKALCQKAMAEIIWDYTHDATAAGRFWDGAITLAEKWPHRMHSLARGALRYGKVQMLQAAGKAEAILSEIASMLGSSRYESREWQVNSYRYYAYRFLAECKHTEGDDKVATELFAQAFAYYPLSVEGSEDKAKAQQAEPAEGYKLFQNMTSRQYLPWEPVLGGRGPERACK